jgi:hypothetical protein
MATPTTQKAKYRVFLLYAPAPRAPAAARRAARALRALHGGGMGGGDDREPLVALEVARLDARRSILRDPFVEDPLEDPLGDPFGDPFGPFHDGLKPPL